MLQSSPWDQAELGLPLKVALVGLHLLPLRFTHSLTGFSWEHFLNKSHAAQWHPRWENCHQRTTPCNKTSLQNCPKTGPPGFKRQMETKPGCNFYQHIIFIGRLQLKGMLNTPKLALFGPEQTHYKIPGLTLHFLFPTPSLGSLEVFPYLSHAPLRKIKKPMTSRSKACFFFSFSSHIYYTQDLLH